MYVYFICNIYVCLCMFCTCAYENMYFMSTLYMHVFVCMHLRQVFCFLLWIDCYYGSSNKIADMMFHFLFQAIYIFGFGVPLFADNNETAHQARWGLWIVHKLLLTAVYGSIFCMHHSKWRERLPGDPHFGMAIMCEHCVVCCSLGIF